MKHNSGNRLSAWALIVSLLITLGIGAVAGLFTEPEIKTWYIYLHKPTFNPPNWIFAPVWTSLYILIGISAWMIWKQRNSMPGYTSAKNIYFVQLFFNFLWSIVFFGTHQIFGAIIIIALLWVCIIINMGKFARLNKTAAWLLLPYLLWVSFAGVLNVSIYLLNR